MRATSVPAFFCQNAGARSEFANLRANMSEATAQRRLRVAGIPKGIRSFGALLPPLLGACQEGASKTTRSARDKVAQYDRM